MSDLIERLYDSGDNESFEGDARLRYLQKQSDEQEPPPGFIGMVFMNVQTLTMDLYRELSLIGTRSIDDIPSRFYMVLKKGDNMPILGLILIFSALILLAFDKPASNLIKE